MKVKSNPAKKPVHIEVDDDLPPVEEIDENSSLEASEEKETNLEENIDLLIQDSDFPENTTETVEAAENKDEKAIDAKTIDSAGHEEDKENEKEEEVNEPTSENEAEEDISSNEIDEPENTFIEEEDGSQKGFVFGAAATAAINEKLDQEEKENIDVETEKEEKRNFSMLREKQKFNASKNFKLGIVGSKGVGKSYLFHSMVYRLQNTIQAGALSYFLKDSHIKIHETIDKQTSAKRIEFTEFIENYMDWRRLAPTKEGTQKWYRLSIPYKSGFFNRGQRSIDVEFFDGAGEIYSAGDAVSQKYWEDNFKDASVIVFCLPLWVAFPNREYRNTYLRRQILNGFERVVNAYQALRSSENVKIATKSILALTMSDEVEKTSLNSELVESWLKPYMLETPDDIPDTSFFDKMNRGGGVNRYLANARKVSNLLNKRFKTCNDVLVSNIPESLVFKAGLPWIIPVSAIRGDFLQSIEDIDEQNKERSDTLSLPDHNPAHVELPLLVALCEHTNALM